MTPEDITSTLKEIFSSLDVQVPVPGSWQVETSKFRLLVLLSEDQSWVRVLVPITAAQEAHLFVEQLLAANFDCTQETRYALHQDALWGVFQHNLDSLSIPDFSTAVARLVALHEKGLSDCFDQLVEQRVRQIIYTAKRQGQSLEATIQTLNRFYREGLLGNMEQGAESREAVLAAWQSQLERLWPQVEPESRLD